MKVSKLIKKVNKENAPPGGWHYRKNKDGFMGSENRIMDKPKANKQYALTGGPGDKCISNGNSWKESEVNEKKN